jgi:PIN domain nuclease of toxin-antitoxin system
VSLLLDSNALIWWVTDDAKLSRRAYGLISGRGEPILVSIASLWELTIKISKDKLPQVGSSIQYLLDEMREQRFDLFPIRTHHLVALGSLERHHRDPFDRIIIAQASAEHLPIVTSDALFSRYPVEIVW